MCNFQTHIQLIDIQGAVIKRPNVTWKLQKTVQWLKQNINQNVKSQRHPITHPQVSYGLSIMRIWDKIDHVIMALNCIEQILSSGPQFNIKMPSYQYRKSHCGDKTVVRSSYLHNGISYTGKTTSLYWIRAQVNASVEPMYAGVSLVDIGHFNVDKTPQLIIGICHVLYQWLGARLLYLHC